MWEGDTPFQEIGMTEDKMQLLEELAEDNTYWKSASKFVRQVSSRKMSSLTVNQQNWLQNISASLAVELDKQIAEDVFEGPEDIPF